MKKHIIDGQKVPLFLENYIKYVRGLQFEEKPDYHFLKTNFNYWLPYIVINKLLVTPSEDQNSIYLSLTISLSGNTVDTRSITLEILNNSNI